MELFKSFFTIAYGNILFLLSEEKDYNGHLQIMRSLRFFDSGSILEMIETLWTIWQKYGKQSKENLTNALLTNNKSQFLNWPTQEKNHRRPSLSVVGSLRKKERMVLHKCTSNLLSTRCVNYDVLCMEFTPFCR